jgi:hypothetical protein
MAENEILDSCGRGWRPTRVALANPDLSLSAVAEAVADNLDSQLAKALRGGQTLLIFFAAAQQDPAAMRAVVQSFQDQQLARIVREAIKVSPAKDPASVAHCVTDMLVDGWIEKTQLLANRSGWGPEKIQALMTVLRQEVESRRRALAVVIEHSLQGHPLRSIRRKRTDKNAPRLDASALVRRPLLLPVGGGNRAPNRT